MSRISSEKCGESAENRHRTVKSYDDIWSITSRHFYGVTGETGVTGVTDMPGRAQAFLACLAYVDMPRRALAYVDMSRRALVCSDVPGRNFSTL